MKDYKVWVGLLIMLAFILIAGALFMVGDQHKAFSQRVDYYTEFTNLNGIVTGVKVRVNGMDGGEVTQINIPSGPAQKFRVKLGVDRRLRGLIRGDSVTSVETQGIVGDEFVLIKSGSSNSPEAQDGATLLSKEPFDLTKMLDQADSVVKQVSVTLTQINGAIADVTKGLDGTLDTVNATVRNANDIVTSIKRGKGTAGVLLKDPQTAENVRAAVANTKLATDNLNAVSSQVKSIVDDLEQRQIVAKADDAMTRVKSATQNLDETSQQLNATLKTAVTPDQYGNDAGQNLRQTLSNINAATGNLADDTEALKHNFFLKGFFKRRGYNNLNELSVSEYQADLLFEHMNRSRQWLTAQELFTNQPDGSETLSATGSAQIDLALRQITDLYDNPIVVEGYANPAEHDQPLLLSRQRAVLIQNFLVRQYHLSPKNVGIVGLSATPPARSGKTVWDGICITQFKVQH